MPSKHAKKLFKSSLLFILIYFLTACSSLNSYNLHLKPKANHSLRIASYNINWGCGAKPIVSPKENLQAILSTNADIVLLQETTLFWQKQIKKSLLSRRYRYQLFKHYENAGGFAVLSKIPFSLQKYELPNLGGWHPYMIVKLQWQRKNIQIVNLHLTPPVETEGNPGFLAYKVFTSKSVRKREIHYIYNQLDHNNAAIIAGDFNEGDIGGTVKFLKNHGFKDAHHRNHHNHYTWHWRHGIFNFYDRFDRVFYNDHFKLINMQVLHLGNSDHYPIIVDVVRNAKYNR